MAQRELRATDEDLLQALQAMLPEEGEGPLLRTVELAEKLGWSVNKVRNLLHELREQGRLIEGRVTLDHGLGRTRPTVPAYGLRKLPSKETGE